MRSRLDDGIRWHPLAVISRRRQAAADELGRNPKDEAARADYNFAVARIITTIRDGKLDPWSQPLRVPSAGGEYLLGHRHDKRKAWNPALYTLTPADQFDVRGTYVRQRSRKEGLGAPLVAVGLEKNPDARKNYTTARIYYGVTAVVTFLRTALHDRSRGSARNGDGDV